MHALLLTHRLVAALCYYLFIAPGGHASGPLTPPRLTYNISSLIGGLTPDGALGPTAEGAKLFKGRGNFHSRDHYAIGPYGSAKYYVIASVTTRRYVTTPTPLTRTSTGDLFADTTQTEFLKMLCAKRESLLKAESAYPAAEPLVLVHGDLHGRNSMVADTRIVAIPWTGSLRARTRWSELLGGESVDVAEAMDEHGDAENGKWAGIIRQLVREVVLERAWPVDHVRWLGFLGRGNYELQLTRGEMFPAMEGVSDGGGRERGGT